MVKAENGEWGERDFYVALELNQVYIEILDEIIASDIKVKSDEVVARTEEHSIRFPNIEAVSLWLRP